MAKSPEPFAGHRSAVRAIALFPDGNRIVTGGDDTKILVWELGSGRLVGGHEGHRDPVLAIATTSDQRIVSCGRSANVSWAAEKPLVTRHRTFIDAAFSPGSDTFAAIDLEGMVLRAPDGPGRPSGHTQVDSVAVTANGQIITAGSGPLIRIVDGSGAELARLAGQVDGDVAVASSANGMHIAYATAAGVYYWDRERQPNPVWLHGDVDVVTVAVAPDGRQVVAGGLSGGIWAWDPNHPGEPIRMPGHNAPVRSFAITPDLRQLISGADDGTIRVWDLMTGAEVSPDTKPKPQPGLASDYETRLDLLGFAEDVDSMAALVTDRESAPPAIALLGRWGSGKSSFMRQLQDRVAFLTERGRRNPARSVFTTAVRQVRFDAWHYNDDHVWVGMVEHLFADLAEPEPPDAGRVRLERESLRDKLRDLEDLADPDAGVARRARARLRLWSANIAPRRGRIALAGVTAVVLGAMAVATWLLWGSPLVTGVLGFLTAASASPIVKWVVRSWRAVRELAGRRVRSLEGEVRDTKVRLARLDAAQRLALVIDEARASGYDQYRGLLGRVHADLRELSDSAREAFVEWDSAGNEGVPPLERVILYIDDLDRCAPRKVVDVLAAVHLLLALPLFVVVVAVDPRWLQRCLAQYHSELFGESADGPGGATPLDYLDKIFQVVFALRPMGKEGDDLVESLVPAMDDTRPALPTRPENGAQFDPAPGGTPRAGDLTATGGPAWQPGPQPELLRLHTTERRFMQRLRPLLETPRAVKRFVNLYRLVRATLTGGRLDEFIGAGGTGPYQAVLILLAVLVSAPDTARTLITALLGPDREGGFTALIEELARDEQSPWARDTWTRLLEILHEAPIPDSLSAYRDWAGTTARFSFETWDLTQPR